MKYKVNWPKFASRVFIFELFIILTIAYFQADILNVLGGEL